MGARALVVVASGAIDLSLFGWTVLPSGLLGLGDSGAGAGAGPSGTAGTAGVTAAADIFGGEVTATWLAKSMLRVLSHALSLPVRPFVCRSLSLSASPWSLLLAWCRPFRACVRVTSVFVRVKPRPLTGP